MTLSKDSCGYVYFARFSKFENLIKIGSSINVERRLNELVCGLGNYELLHTIPTLKVLKLEKEIHSGLRQFQRCNNCSTEFFEISIRQLFYIIENYRRIGFCEICKNLNDESNIQLNGPFSFDNNWKTEAFILSL